MKDFPFKNQIKNLNNSTKKFGQFFLPVFLSSAFLISLVIYQWLGRFVEQQKLLPPPIDAVNINPYPISSFLSQPNISAQAALVMDNTSKVIIYEKNPDLRFSPASTTKIMTALTAFSYFKPEDILTVKASNVEPVVIGFFPGEKITFLNLLKGMLIPSGNDAALAISQNFPGGETAFIAKMNENANILHMGNTHFGDPVGLTDDETYTTVTDLAKLVSVALENALFRTIVKTKSTTIANADNSIIYPIKTTNELLGLYGIDGVKTGFTEGAGEVLVTSLERNGHTFIIIVMKSNDRFADTQTLISDIVDTTSFLAIHL